MSGRPPPRLGRQSGSSVSALFRRREDANKATRALQKDLGLRPGDVSAVLAPGAGESEAHAVKGEGYLGITKIGGTIVHARVRDPDGAERVRALFGKLGGELIGDETNSPSTGGYGPTTAHGSVSVFGGAASTSAMAAHRFTYQEKQAEPEKPAEG